MEPLTIITASVGLGKTIGEVAIKAYEFGSKVRQARSQMLIVKCELDSLKSALTLLTEDLQHPAVAHMADIPDPIEPCQLIVRKLDETLDKYNHDYLKDKLKYAWSGKETIDAHRSNLAVHTSALHFTISIINLWVDRDTNNIVRDSAQIGRDTQATVVQIKDNTQDIERKIDQLIKQLPEEPLLLNVLPQMTGSVAGDPPQSFLAASRPSSIADRTEDEVLRLQRLDLERDLTAFEKKKAEDAARWNEEFRLREDAIKRKAEDSRQRIIQLKQKARADEEEHSFGSSSEERAPEVFESSLAASRPRSNAKGSETDHDKDSNVWDLGATSLSFNKIPLSIHQSPTTTRDSTALQTATFENEASQSSNKSVSLPSLRGELDAHDEISPMATTSSLSREPSARLSVSGDLAVRPNQKNPISSTADGSTTNPGRPTTSRWDDFLSAGSVSESRKGDEPSTSIGGVAFKRSLESIFEQVGSALLSQNLALSYKTELSSCYRLHQNTLSEDELPADDVLSCDSPWKWINDFAGNDLDADLARTRIVQDLANIKSRTGLIYNNFWELPVGMWRRRLRGISNSPGVVVEEAPFTLWQIGFDKQFSTNDGISLGTNSWGAIGPSLQEQWLVTQIVRAKCLSLDPCIMPSFFLRRSTRHTCDDYELSTLLLALQVRDWRWTCHILKQRLPIRRVGYSLYYESKFVDPSFSEKIFVAAWSWHFGLAMLLQKCYGFHNETYALIVSTSRAEFQSEYEKKLLKELLTSPSTWRTEKLLEWVSETEQGLFSVLVEYADMAKVIQKLADRFARLVDASNIKYVKALVDRGAGLSEIVREMIDEEKMIDGEGYQRLQILRHCGCIPESMLGDVDTIISKKPKHKSSLMSALARLGLRSK